MTTNVRCWLQGGRGAGPVLKSGRNRYCVKVCHPGRGYKVRFAYWRSCYKYPGSRAPLSNRAELHQRTAGSISTLQVTPPLNFLININPLETFFSLSLFARPGHPPTFDSEAAGEYPAISKLRSCGGRVAAGDGPVVAILLGFATARRRISVREAWPRTRNVARGRHPTLKK